jgi:2-haloacid dehalogenase
VHVLFDLNGTLLDAGALTDRWPGGRGAALRVLDDAVWQAHADTLTGEFRPFPEYLRAALGRAAAAVGVGDDMVEAGMEAARALPAFQDARPALDALRSAGHEVHVLTNSAGEAAQAALDAAGLRVGHVIGCDAVGAYKPDPRTYRHALEAIGAEAGETWLVAAHWWDVLGAKRAGLRTAWVGRDEGALLSTVPTPDAAAADLAGIAERIAVA